MSNNISIEETYKYLNELVDKKISKVWCGYAGVLFLEIGELHKILQKNKDPKKNFITEKGNFTIMIESNWKIIKEKEVFLDIRTANYPIEKKHLSKLKNLKIKDFEFTKKIRFVYINLNNGFQIKICRQPKFNFLGVNFINKNAWLGFESDGKIVWN